MAKKKRKAKRNRRRPVAKSRRVRNTGWIKAKAVKILKKAGGYIVKVRR
jgi:hypothetical protein